MLTRQKKKNVIKKFQQHGQDTGSTEVQIAILSSEINELVSHLKMHHKDQSSRKGLLRKIGERRRLLRYLEKENKESYEALVKKLKLKQAKALLKKEKEEKAAETEVEVEVEDESKDEENGTEE